MLTANLSKKAKITCSCIHVSIHEYKKHGLGVLSVIVFIMIFFLLSGSVFAQVVINEFSSNTSSDWVELYAYEDTNINGWSIYDDAEKNPLIYIIEQDVFLGPSTERFYVAVVKNRLNKAGDTITLHNEAGDKIDEIVYGGKDNICLPTDEGSIGRYPDANSTWERFQFHTKGQSNNNVTLFPCPSPTPLPTAKPDPTKRPTNTPVQRSTQTPTQTEENDPPSQVMGSEEINSDHLEIETYNDKQEEIERDHPVYGSYITPRSTEPAQDEQYAGSEVNRNYMTAGLFIIGGLGFIGAAVYPIIKKKGLIARIFRYEK